MTQVTSAALWSDRNAATSATLGRLVAAPVNMAFEWNYGDPLPAGLTFVGDANRTKLDATGTVIPVGANVPRNDGYVYDKNGVLQPGWLIEGAATNLLLRSGSIGGTSWTKTGGVLPTVTLNAVTAPDGTLAGTQIDFSTSAPNGVFQSATTASDGTSPYTFSVWLKADAPGTIDLACAGSENGSTVVNVTTSWARYKMTTTAGGGAVAGSYLRRQNTGQLARIYAWGAQLEIGAFATSHVPTTSATVTRAAESCAPPWPYWPQQQTVYVKGINCGTGQLASTAYLEIGNNTEGIIVWNNAGVLRVSHRVGGTLVQCDQAVAPVLGDAFEIRALINANGSVNSGQSINAATETTSSVSSTLAFTGAWGVPQIRPGGGVMVSPGFFAFQSIRLALNAWSMDQMRKVAPEPGAFMFAESGAPAASLVGDPVNGYDISDTNLRGTGKLAILGSSGTGEIY